MKRALALVVLSFAGTAHAEPCLRVNAPLDAAWTEAVRATERELAGNCGDSKLTLGRDGRRIVIDVVAPDGRQGERFVERPRDLASTVAGLVATVPEIPAEPAPEPAPAPVAPPAPSLLVVHDRDVAPAPPRDALDSLATIGATFGTKMGLPTRVLSTDLELRGDVRIDRWVVSLSGRASPSGARIGGHDEWEYGELSVGALGGRNFRIGDSLLTLTVGPRLAMTTRETDTQSKSRRDLVAQFAARWVAPVGDRWRPAIALETEAVPLHVASAGGLPSWSSSLRFGIVGFGP